MLRPHELPAYSATTRRGNVPRTHAQYFRPRPQGAPATHSAQGVHFMPPLPQQVNSSLWAGGVWLRGACCARRKPWVRSLCRSLHDIRSWAGTELLFFLLHPQWSQLGEVQEAPTMLHGKSNPASCPCRVSGPPSRLAHSLCAFLDQTARSTRIPKLPRVWGWDL